MPDPLAEDYITQSPYHFSGNNPIYFVDDNGMNYDGYTVDIDGKIERVDDTGGDEYDVLYTKADYDKTKQATKEDGTLKNEYGNPDPVSQLRFTDTDILPSLAAGLVKVPTKLDFFQEGRSLNTGGGGANPGPSTVKTSHTTKTYSDFDWVKKKFILVEGPKMNYDYNTVDEAFGYSWKKSYNKNLEYKNPTFLDEVFQIGIKADHVTRRIYDAAYGDLEGAGTTTTIIFNYDD